MSWIKTILKAKELNGMNMQYAKRNTERIKSFGTQLEKGQEADLKSAGKARIKTSWINWVNRKGS